MNFILKKFISGLLSHLCKAAENESKTHAGSRTVVYSWAAKRMLFVGVAVVLLVFTLAISSQPETRQADLAVFLGFILLLPLALAAAELMLTRITYDEMRLSVSSPWRHRSIPWSAVTECIMVDGEYNVKLRTQGHGDVKMNLFMRGVGDLVEYRGVWQDGSDLPHGAPLSMQVFPIAVVQRKDYFAEIFGSFFALAGVAIMTMAVIERQPQASDFATISGKMINYHRFEKKDVRELTFWIVESAGPLRPGINLPHLHFTFRNYPPSFQESDFLHSASSGAFITMTVPATDLARIRINGTSMQAPVRTVALRIGDKEYYSLAQYLATEQQGRIFVMLGGAGLAIAGSLALFLKRRKKSYKLSTVGSIPSATCD
jgi:hypothetical protein